MTTNGEETAATDLFVRQFRIIIATWRCGNCGDDFLAAGRRWTDSETKQALYLYFQLPFGQLHSRNPEIVALAQSVDRTPGSIAMKLANFASLDPAIVGSGRRGLDGASALDRQVWSDFNSDWTRAIVDAALASRLDGRISESAVRDNVSPFASPWTGEATTRHAEIEQRIGQPFFRRAVMANFEESCCVTGIADLRLLNASHIVSWKDDVANRHNPRNGLCLSATFDRAFDRHLLTVLPDLTIRISSQLLGATSADTRAFFAPYEGQQIRRATHVVPDPVLLQNHNAMFLP